MHLFNKENIWSNPCSFLHTSSHPDKYNNSAYRIIPKGKGRERRSKERFFKDLKDLIPVQIQCLYMQSSNYNYKFNSAYQINSTTRNSKEIQQLQGSSREGIFQQLLPMYPRILHGRNKAPSALQCSRPLQ